jgi:coenzyme F420-reducing hydrogenase beta subunit
VGCAYASLTCVIAMEGNGVDFDVVQTRTEDDLRRTQKSRLAVWRGLPCIATAQRNTGKMHGFGAIPGLCCAASGLHTIVVPASGSKVVP